MGTRDLSHALTAVVLAGALGAPSFAQGAGLPPNLQRLQDAAVAAERRERFFELWESAPGTLRDAAADALARVAPAGRRLDGWPSTEELALAIHVLEGETLADVQADPLVAFADALGLLVVPGVARVDPERGEPLTVRVHQARRVELEGGLEGELELGLYWVAPDGSEERARREPFPAQAFLRGFPMYVRAPRRPGSWWLVPEVTRGDRTVRGFGVPFQTLAELPDAGLDERLELLRTQGVRCAGGAGWAQPAAPADLPTSHGVLLVATGRDEEPESFHHGRNGERWRTLAAELELELVVLPAADVAGYLASGGGPTYLLARGDAVSELHLALLGHDVTLAGLVLSTSMERPGPALPEVPTLLVGPRREADSGGDPADLQRVEGGPTPFLTEPVLPELVAPWLRERLEGG